MDKLRAMELYKKVIKDYNYISDDFSASREKHIFFWPEFLEIKKIIGKNKKILDIGCGNGRLFEAIKDLNPSYMGIDPSIKLLKIAKKKYEGKTNFKKGDFLDIPCEDSFFDIVVAVASFHHVPSNKLRENALKEIKRVLKKDGLLILTVWNLWQPKYEKYVVKDKKKAAKKNLEIGDSFIPWKGEIARYYHAFREEELNLILDKEFEVKKIIKTSYNFLAIVKKKTVVII